MDCGWRFRSWAIQCIRFIQVGMCVCWECVSVCVFILCRSSKPSMCLCLQCLSGLCFDVCCFWRLFYLCFPICGIIQVKSDWFTFWFTFYTIMFKYAVAVGPNCNWKKNRFMMPIFILTFSVLSFLFTILQRKMFILEFFLMSILFEDV